MTGRQLTTVGVSSHKGSNYWRNADSNDGVQNYQEHVISRTGFNPCCCCFCSGRCPLSNWCLILGVVGIVMYLPILCIAFSFRHDIFTLNLEELFEDLISRGWNLKIFNIHTSLGLARTVQLYASLSCIMLIGHFILIFSSTKMSKLGSLGHPIILAGALVVQLVFYLVFQVGNEGISPIWLFFNFPFEVFVGVCSLGLFSQIRAFLIEKTRSCYSSECERRSDSRLRDVNTEFSSESDSNNFLVQREDFQTGKQSKNFSKTRQFTSRGTVVNEKSQVKELDHLSLTSVNNNNHYTSTGTDSNNNNNNNIDERNQRTINTNLPQRYIVDPSKACIARLQPTVGVLHTSKSQMRMQASGKSSQLPANPEKTINHRNNNDFSKDILRDLEEEKLYRDLEITRKRRTEQPKRHTSRRKSKHRHRKHRSRSRRRR